MNIRLCLPLVLLITLGSLNASIFERLRVAETDYRFTVNDAPLNVVQQGLSLRTVTKEYREKNSDAPDSVDHVAYQEYHLELAYELDLMDRRRFVRVEFYKGNDRLHSIDLKDSSRLISTSVGQRYEINFLAVNLEGMPLLALDSVDRVNFIKAK